MFNNADSMFEMGARAFAMYGETIPPFEDDEQPIKCWLEDWRGAAPVCEEQTNCVKRFPFYAIAALWQPRLTIEEHFLLFDDLLRLFSEQVLPAEACEAWSKAMLQWKEEYFPKYRVDPDTGFPCAPIELLPLLPNPYFNPSPSPPPQPKKRGRKLGSKDKEKRAARGTKFHLSPAERSREWRQRNKLRKVQQQTPPPEN